MTLQHSFFFHTKEKLISFEKIIAGASLFLLLALSLSQVFLRNFFDLGFSEIDVMSRHLVLFVTFMGAALACESGRHIKMDFLNTLMSEKLKDNLKYPLLFLCGLICTVFFIYSVQFWLDEKTYAPTNERLALYLALIIPVGFFTLSLHFFLLLLSPANTATDTNK